MILYVFIPILIIISIVNVVPAIVSLVRQITTYLCCGSLSAFLRRDVRELTAKNL